MQKYPPGSQGYEMQREMEIFHQQYLADLYQTAKTPAPTQYSRQPPAKANPALVLHNFLTQADPMNLSTAIFLVNDDVRAVKAAYEFDAEGKPIAGKTYTFKTLNKSLKVGDIAVIPTDSRVGFTCVQITEVDVEPDLESGIQFKWIVDNVNVEAYKSVLAQEASMQTAIHSAEKRAKRESLREKLLKDNPDLMGISLAKDAPVLPAPPEVVGVKPD